MENPIIRMQQDADDEASRFIDWVDNNNDLILEAYADQLTMKDVPDDFINKLWERQQEPDEDALYEAMRDARDDVQWKR